MQTRGLGYIPDTHDKTLDPSTRSLFGARVGLPAAASLEGYIDRIRDQGPTSSCVGFAFARAVHIRCAKLGVPIAWPSPTAIYSVARALARQDASEPLMDEGSMPRLAVQGMDQWGIPADEQWPVGGFDPDKINAEPDLQQLEEASTFLLQGYYRIDSWGATRVEEIKQAISEGFPVVGGFTVDKAFMEYGGQGLVTEPDPDELQGGHMLCMVGYNDGVYRGCNSWGNGWGDLGMFNADERFLTNPYVGDLYVITVTST